MTIEEKIYSFEEENTVIGIGNASPFYYMIPILEKIKVPFVNYDIQTRIDPKLTKKNAKSIITLCMSYNKKYVGKLDDKLRGNMSIGAIGTDYHIIIKNKLENIKNSLFLDGDIFVDTGPLIDREVAKRCGLCACGKSQNMINKKLGSVMFIGYMLVSENLRQTENIYTEDMCKNCDNCIKYCPTNAITKDGFDYTKCISYLTQKKHLENDFEKIAINKQIYGCDICQKVCPHNKDVYAENIDDIDAFFPDIEHLLSITNKQFDETYKKRACGWQGKKILQRNAIIVLSNGAYSEKAISILEKMVGDKRENISECAKYALNKLKGKKNGIF